MAKRFWEREEFRIELFVAIFRQVYDLYYDAPEGQTDEREMTVEGDRLMQDAENAPLLKAYAAHEQDVPTSDREVAAFAVTYGVFQGRYK